MKRGDRIMAVITGAGALMMAAGLLMRGPADTHSARTAEIVVGGRVLHKIALDGRPREIRVETPEGFNIIKTDGRGAAVISADCPDGVCIRMGRITRPGSGAVCLPHRLLLRIRDRNIKNEVDSVTW
ncbi:MAG: NusG domain II-containing protein [Synergistes sp.]|nr:NusG domain II-containing protein [Synergistes sp.]